MSSSNTVSGCKAGGGLISAGIIDALESIEAVHSRKKKRQPKGRGNHHDRRIVKWSSDTFDLTCSSSQIGCFGGSFSLEPESKRQTETTLVRS